MTPLDIQLLRNAKNVLGRSAWRLLTSAYAATASDPGGGATFFNIILPAPQQGMIRYWDLLTCSWTAPVAGNRLVVFLQPNGVGPGINISEYRFVTGLVIPGSTVQWPLVGSTLNINGTNFGNWFGGPEILAGAEDVLTFTAVFTAASGQTATLNGRYVDFPA